MAEDLGSIVNGTATGPHSAYDERNAKAMAEKTGSDKKNYHRGGYSGPGGLGYSASALHAAGIAARAEQTAQSDTNRANRQTASNRNADTNTQGMLGVKDVPAPANVETTGMLTTKSKVQSFTAAMTRSKPAVQSKPVVQDEPLDENPTFTPSSGPKTRSAATTPASSDASVMPSKAAPGADPRLAPSATPAQQARNIDQARKEQARKDQARKDQARQQAQDRKAAFDAISKQTWHNAGSRTPAPQRTPDQKAADVGEPPRASRNSLSTVTSPANEFAGVLGSGAPVGSSPFKDLYDRALAATANAKAASVAEQPSSWLEQQATPQLSAEAAAANARAAKALAKTTDLTTAAGYLNDALKTGGAQAQLEAADLVQQLDAIAPGQGQKLAALTGITGPQTGNGVTTDWGVQQPFSAADQLNQKIAKSPSEGLPNGLNSLDGATKINPARLGAAGDLGKVALAGAIAERYYRNDNRYQGQLAGVLSELNQQGHTKLVGELTRFRADALTQKEWQPATMSNEELQKAIDDNVAIASSLFDVAVAGRGGPVTYLVGAAMAGFANAVDEMKDEKERRAKKSSGSRSR